MKDILQTNDMVFLSFVQALLRDAGIESLVLDEHASVVEGSLGMLPRRLMVEESDLGRAKTILAQAERERTGEVPVSFGGDGDGPA